jgi:hypothetical protein
LSFVDRLWFSTVEIEVRGEDWGSRVGLGKMGVAVGVREGTEGEGR